MDGFANPATIGPDGMVQFAASNSYVEFYSRAVHNQVKSEKEGRPVYEPRDFVKVIHPGERDYADREVQEIDKMRWPRQWAAYQNKQEQAPEGTPLDHLFPQNPEIVATLRHVKFFTVEQLANATDSQLQGIGMGSRDWQNKAKRFLEAANGAQGFHKLQSEVDQLRTERDSLKDAVMKMQARLELLESNEPKRGPGRPRKVEAA